MPVILTTQEAEISRMAVQGQPRQIVHKNYLENPITIKGWQSGSRCRPWVQTPVLKKKKFPPVSESSGALWIMWFFTLTNWRRHYILDLLWAPMVILSGPFGCFFPWPSGILFLPCIHWSDSKDPHRSPGFSLLANYSGFETIVIPPPV
jgi:hypothetical protein